MRDGSCPPWGVRCGPLPERSLRARLVARRQPHRLPPAGVRRSAVRHREGREGRAPDLSARPGVVPTNHFPVWSPDGAFIYFVQGFPLDEMDVWRIPSLGGEPEKLTSHDGPRQLSHLCSGVGRSSTCPPTPRRIRTLDLRDGHRAPRAPTASARASRSTPLSRRARTGGGSWPRYPGRRPDCGECPSPTTSSTSRGPRHRAAHRARVVATRRAPGSSSIERREAERMAS